MCGICGIVTPGRISPDRLSRMNATLWRRGPDDSGEFIDRDVGLAMRRLSIIDIEGSPQPISSSDGRYIGVYNGEIYNFRELRKELESAGHRFRTAGDGEVVLNAFAEYGLRGLAKLRGMFGVAIWDRRDRRLWLARDQLGIKPLFFAHRAQSLVFGSEIKALLAHGEIDVGIDPAAVDAFFAYTYIPAPLTIYKGIRKLEPGTCLEWHEGRVRSHRYWDLREEANLTGEGRPDFRQCVEESVRAHLVSDVPVGAFLSGGVDSSAIVSRVPPKMLPEFRAYTVKFEQTRSHLFDETPYAEDLRERYGFDLAIRKVAMHFEQSLDEGLQAFDEPFADDSIIPSFEISRVASETLKVCLSGAGGDELFGGYNRYQGLALQSSLDRWSPGPVQPALAATFGALASVLGRQTRRGDLVARFSREMGKPLEQAYLSYVTSLTRDERRALLAPHIVAEASQPETEDLILRHFADSPWGDPVHSAMYADTQTYLPEDVLALGDRLGMWHSLEIRTPFADKDLAVAAFSVPRPEHVTGRRKKIALKSAVSEWLPSSITSHPKQGFESPTAAWLKGAGSTRFERNVLGTVEVWGETLSPAKVEDLWNEHRTGQRDRAKSLFAILVLARWLQEREAPATYE